MILTTIKSLCQPAYVYLVISVVLTVFQLFQNMGNSNSYCVGSFECAVPSTSLIFIIKFISIAFWTFVLNAICKAGYKQVSWFLVILPFLVAFIAIGLLMLNQGVRY